MSIVDVVVGAAYGSEGKGHITAQLVQKRLDSDLTVLNVRVAGPNAGHTVIDSNGESFALRAVPVGAAIGDDVWLYIAPGSEIDPDVLFAEVDLLRSKGHNVGHLVVSGEATILTEQHKQEEAGRSLTERTGSTGKGIGAARADRIWREARRVKDSAVLLDLMEERGIEVAADESYIHRWAEMTRAAIIIEGTQGYGLGLHAGHYPQSTSSDCRAVDFLAMAGLSPWHIGVRHIAVWLVARVFPIRVAGNSGPLKGETSWDELGLPEEHTTVTHKVRRVGEWDAELVARAVQANGGGQNHERTQVMIALTMVDQKFPAIKGEHSARKFLETAEPDQVRGFSRFLRQVEADANAEVGVVSTSDRTVIWR